jgi:CheY-like chemotaxis protein
VPERDLKHIAGESQRAAEIVSRLVSFARPEDSDATHVDVTALVASLMKFRDPEWKTLGLRIHNRLAPEPAVVLGAQGQIEQVFLNLLVHAEQRAGQAPGKAIAVSSSVIARRVTVEIKYSTPLPESDEGEREQPSAEAHTLESTAMGLGVCQGIIQSHGGEIRFSSSSGSARFEVDLPVAQDTERSDSADRNSGTPLTLMLVDPDAGNQRQLVALLGARGHRVVPVQPEESVDLAQRLRFDAVIWMVRPSGGRWSDFQERIRTYIGMFVLLSEGYDAELARTLEENGGFLLGRPIQEAELDRVLKAIEGRVPNASAARGR